MRGAHGSQAIIKRSRHFIDKRPVRHGFAPQTHARPGRKASETMKTNLLKAAIGATLLAAVIAPATSGSVLVYADGVCTWDPNQEANFAYGDARADAWGDLVNHVGSSYSATATAEGVTVSDAGSWPLKTYAHAEIRTPTHPAAYGYRATASAEAHETYVNGAVERAFTKDEQMCTGGAPRDGVGGIPVIVDCKGGSNGFSILGEGVLLHSSMGDDAGNHAFMRFDSGLGDSIVISGIDSITLRCVPEWGNEVEVPSDARVVGRVVVTANALLTMVTINNQ